MKKKNPNLYMIPALVLGVGFILYMVLVRGVTDNYVFIVGGVIAGAAVLILFLLFGREKSQEKETKSSAGKNLPNPVIALKNYNKTAIHQIDDPEILYEIATIDFGLEENLHMFYADPFKWNPQDRYRPGGENDWSKIRERDDIRRNNASVAVERLNDPELLEKIIRKHNIVSLEAAEKLCRIRPEAALAMAEDESFSIPERKVALMTLSDETVLKERYPQIENDQLRLVMISHISDEAFLADVADHSKSKEVGAAAAVKVSDPEKRLIYCMKYGTHEWVFDRTESQENGEHLDITDYYHCKFCGETKRESERIRM
ncbi:MAG: hypothetical protein J5589_00290 [Firmicutes bacterium]|nr:hypothetical protein [Bacillota bacterium]